MTLKEQLRSDMVDAMKSGDKEKRDAVRMILAAIKQYEVDEQVDLDDDGVGAILAKQAKQRKESIADYTAAGNIERADEERYELNVIEAYLPELMDRTEIEAAAATVIEELGITDMRGMGQVMGNLMPQLHGKADGRLVSEVVRGLLQGS